ncbi:hypothetical protein ACTG9Q_27470 [Actinokineospora sp. 24-640]
MNRVSTWGKRIFATTAGVAAVAGLLVTAGGTASAATARTQYVGLCVDSHIKATASIQFASGFSSWIVTPGSCWRSQVVPGTTMRLRVSSYDGRQASLTSWQSFPANVHPCGRGWTSNGTPRGGFEQLSASQVALCHAR